VLVGLWPQYFAYVVTLWLWGIIINLLTLSGYYDVALRDFGLSVGALSLARLAHAHQLELKGQLAPAEVIPDRKRELAVNRS
jgi:hypothetical protein